MSISSYMEDKKAKAKAQSDAGLGGLLKVLGGAASGFLMSGFNPIGALIGAGTGLVGAATGGGDTVKDTQSALDKFNAWKQQRQAPPTPEYGNTDATGWKGVWS